MENQKTIWHIELYDKDTQQHIDDIYFAHNKAAKLYIATQKGLWDTQNLVYSFGGETLWL